MSKGYLNDPKGGGDWQLLTDKICSVIYDTDYSSIQPEDVEKLNDVYFDKGKS